MTSDDDDFERALSLYSEIETIPKEQAPQPRTIRQYHQKIQLNNSTSIFDLDYTLDGRANNNHRSGCSAELDKTLDQDFGVFKDEKVTYTISGRGRGGRNIYINPGEPNLNKAVNAEDEVWQQIRKVAPIGYGNEITESAVRAYQMSKVMKQDTNRNSKPSSPALLKVSSDAASIRPGQSKTKSTANNNSPSLSGKSTPCTSMSPAKSKTKSIPNSDSPSSSGKSTPCTSMSPAKSKTKSIPNSDSLSSSGKSTPCSTASDIPSSEYYTSQDHNVSSGSSKSDRNAEVKDESDKSKDTFSDASSASTSRTRPKFEMNTGGNVSSGSSSRSHRNGEDDVSEKSKAEFSEGSSASPSRTRPKAEVNTGVIPKMPPPLSVILKQNRELHKKKQLNRQAALINDYSKENYENDLASRRTIDAILREDLLEKDMRKKLRLNNSSGSRDNVLPWRMRNNSPPRHTWGQADWRREPRQLDINSVDDFPALT